MAEDFHIQYFDEPTEAMSAAIGGGLRAFNFQQVGDHHFKRLCFVLYDPGGEIAGGVIGETYWGWLFVRPVVCTGGPARSWVRRPAAKHGRGGRPEERGQACLPGHVQLPGAGILSKTWLHGVWGAGGFSGRAPAVFFDETTVRLSLTPTLSQRERERPFPKERETHFSQRERGTQTSKPAR